MAYPISLKKAFCAYASFCQLNYPVHYQKTVSRQSVLAVFVKTWIWSAHIWEGHIKEQEISRESIQHLSMSKIHNWNYVQLKVNTFEIGQLLIALKTLALLSKAENCCANTLGRPAVTPSLS